LLPTVISSPLQSRTQISAAAAAPPASAAIDYIASLTPPIHLPEFEAALRFRLRQ
jgi:hypothetical protein